MIKVTLLVAILGVAAVAAAPREFNDEEAGAWHFHTYFFEVNPQKSAEAVAFRKALRSKIDDGYLEGCSLNQMMVGWDGPHPVSQWETCCNKTSFSKAFSWFSRNHANLSVMIHPLTKYDLADHVDYSSWLGQEVILDAECPCLYEELPQARPCPIYPRYSDDIPRDPEDLEDPHPGTEPEDYKAYKLKVQQDLDAEGEEEVEEEEELLEELVEIEEEEAEVEEVVEVVEETEQE